jgi:hypothetical protein
MHYCSLLVDTTSASLLTTLFLLVRNIVLISMMEQDKHVLWNIPRSYRLAGTYFAQNVISTPARCKKVFSLYDESFSHAPSGNR